METMRWLAVRGILPLRLGNFSECFAIGIHTFHGATRLGIPDVPLGRRCGFQCLLLEGEGGCGGLKYGTCSMSGLVLVRC